MNTLPVPTQKFRGLRRIGKFFGLGLLVLFGLIALLLVGISMKGRRDLAETKKQLLVQGEKLTLTELAPPPLPDEENFFADPMWMELADVVPSDEYPGAWALRLPKGERQLDGLQRALTEEEQTSLESQFPEFADQLAKDPTVGVAWTVWKAVEKESDGDQKRAAEFVLAVQATVQPLVSKIEALMDRDGASFPIRYQDGAGLSFEHFNYLLPVGRFFNLNARANIALGRTHPAQQDVKAIFKLADTLATEPLLISLLVRAGLQTMALSLINEGIKQHVWSDGDLAQFENRLAGADLRPWLVLAFRGERAWFNQIMEHLLSPQDSANRTNVPTPGGLPRFTGFFPKLLWNGFLQIFGPGDQAAYNQIMQSAIATTRASSSLRPQEFSIFSDQKRHQGFRRYSHILTSLALPALDGVVLQIAAVQTQMDQTRIACALERFRIARGEYPESLSLLVPLFLAKPPLDGITGEPMFYRKLPNGEFLLWSVGGNKSNEAGVPGKTKSEGDWVWGERIR